MSKPLRALYGAKDNKHDLLEWQGQPHSLPSDLLGFTDRPTGNYRPSDCWSPALGCGAVGDWWAMWWTVPDETVSRGGMVRSEVALWRLDEIGAVNDLRPILTLLSGRETIPATSPELLRAVAEALVSPEYRRPLVIPDLEVWAGIIADLWTRLWSEARSDFSARVAISPPQSGESVAPPLLFCVPSQRVLEWSDYPVIRNDSGAKPISRAAAWLMGKNDTTFNEVLTACNSYPSNLKGLSAVARAADRLDKLREHSNPQNAIELLRTLAALAPEQNAATSLKIEALRELNRSFNDVKPEFVFLLKNLASASLPIEELPESSLTTWISSHASRLSLSDTQKLLDGLSENKAQAWWQQSVCKALSDKLAAPDKQWAESALNWLGLPNCAEILNAILPATEKVESSLLAVSAQVTLSETALQQLQAQTEMRNWSRLHAWAVMKAFSPSEAFRLQRQFSDSALTGLTYLVEHLSGNDVINEVISTPDNQLIQLVAQRTAKEPQLLQALDVSHAVWLELWVAHIVAGGDCWSPTANREVLGSNLLNIMLAEKKEPQGLIVPLAKDLANIVFNHSNRAELWAVLSSNSCEVLLPFVADVLIQNCNAGHTITSPEPKLAQEVLKQLRTTHSSIKVFVVLSSSVSLTEQDLIRCISSSTRIDWQPAIASIIGKLVLNKRWDGAAEKIYDQFKKYKTPELRSAVEICQEQLSFMQRLNFYLEKMGNNSSISPNMEIIKAVAECGAEFAPDELDDIWERAGGKRKDLNIGGSSTSRWQQAANLAQNGKLDGGLPALVSELKKSYPYNNTLIDLEQIISDVQYRR